MDHDLFTNHSQNKIISFPTVSNSYPILEISLSRRDPKGNGVERSGTWVLIYLVDI